VTDISAQALVTNGDVALQRVLALADSDPHRTPGGTYSAKRVADVLLHLHAWHLIFDTWMSEHRRGSVPAVPAAGYSWADIDALNGELYLAYRDLGYDEARVLVTTSHRHMCEQVLGFSEADLSVAGAFPWLGDQRLGDVIHEFLAGHYAWGEDVLAIR
jgi:hypothetical protein